MNSDAFAGLFAKPRGEDLSGRPISIPLNKKQGKKEVLGAVGAPASYLIGGTDEAAFEAEAETRVVAAIGDLSEALGGPAAPTGEMKDQLIAAIGVKDIAGKIFEGVVKNITGHFGGT